MSVIYDVKAAVITILGNDSTLDAVDQRWAPPTEAEDYQQEPEVIYLSDCEIVEDDWAELGRHQGTGRRRQTWRVSVSVLVARTGDDPQSTEQRAWEIWDRLELDIRTDVFATGSLIRAAGALQFDDITAFQVTGVWGPQAWAARIDGRIFFQAIT